MSPHDIKRIANTPGFGTGKRTRDMLAAESEAVAKLPKPSMLPPVMASQNAGDNWPIASFGTDDDGDWHLVTDHVRASEVVDLAMPDSARRDAETVAAVLNAYRLGLLVVKDRDA